MKEKEAFNKLKEAEQSGIVKVIKKIDEDGVLNLSLECPQGATEEEYWEFIKLLTRSSGMVVRREFEDRSNLTFAEKLQRRLYI